MYGFKLRPTSGTKRSSRCEPTSGVSLGVNAAREVDRSAHVANDVSLNVHAVSGMQFPGKTVCIQHHVVQKAHSRTICANPLTKPLEHHIPSVTGETSPRKPGRRLTNIL